MNDFIELRQLIAVFLRRWWIMLLLAVVGAALGYGISQKLPPVYEATAVLNVGRSIQATNVDSRDIQTSEMLALTYAEMAHRQPVLQGAVDALGLDVNWQQLRNQVQVDPVSGTQLLEVTAEAGSPEEATLIADEIAHQLILLSPTTLQNEGDDDTTQFVQERLTSLQKRIEEGQGRIAGLEEAMATAATAAEMRDLQDEINVVEGLITDWENSYAQLLTSVKEEQPVNYLSVAVGAQAKLAPVRPLIRVNTLLAGVVGLFLAVGLIFTLEYFDDSIKSTADLQKALQLTPLGTVGHMSGKNAQDRLLTAQGAMSPIAETYRMIRTNLQFMSLDRACKAIMVTSAAPVEGKSTTVANLGIVMAQAGLKTVIVDADLRRPKQHKIFQLPGNRGLTDLIRQPEFDVAHYLFPTQVQRLSVLASGPLPPNPAEILGLRQIEHLLAQLKEVADVIIIDSPPAAAVTDAAVLSNRVDGVVLVVRAGETRRALVKSAVANLQQAGATLLGAVLNGVSTKQGAYYYGRYSSDYEHDESEKRPIYARWFKSLKPSPLFRQSALPGDNMHRTHRNG